MRRNRCRRRHLGTEDSERVAGRPRDESIDDAVLDATLRRLARDGFTGLSLASVAADAGTSRPAIYRRWPDKESLVVDAIALLAQSVPPPDIGEDPFEDLVAELEHFRHCITEAGALPVAGLMLGDGVNEVLCAKYHDLVVVPRRSRIRACLQRGIDDGSLDPTQTSSSPGPSSPAPGMSSRSPVPPRPTTGHDVPPRSSGGHAVADRCDGPPRPSGSWSSRPFRMSLDSSGGIAHTGWVSEVEVTDQFIEWRSTFSDTPARGRSQATRQRRKPLDTLHAFMTGYLP